MESNKKVYRINPGIATAVVLQLIFVVFASITIYNILNHKVGVPKIEISNYSAIPSGELVGENGVAPNNLGIKFSLDDADKRTIESTIYNAALLNSEGSMANSGAKIREDSAYYVYIEDLNDYFLNFIVDIEGLGQSYRFVWLFNNDPKKGENPKVVRLMAFCPRKDEMIYGDFDCRDEYDGRGTDIIVYDLLRYKMFGNFTVGLSDIDNNKPLQISINVSSNDDIARDAAIQKVSNYLSGLGFSLEDFDYDVSFLETLR